MARSFAAASSEYLSYGSAIMTAYPMTVATWARLDQLPSVYGDEFVIVGEGLGGGGDWSDFLTLRADDGTDALQFNFRFDNGTTEVAQTTADVTAGVWEHYCGTAASATDRAVFLNGGNKGVSVNSVTFPAGLVNTTIGAVYGGALTDFTDGAIAEVAIWNVALTDAEVAILAAGFSPLFVRTASLVSYWPLIRDEDQDRVGGYDMTDNNTPTIAAHPPMIYPARPHIIAGAAGAPPSVTIPIMMKYYRQLRV